MKSTTELQKEIETAKQYLHRLESRLRQAQRVKVSITRHETEKERLDRIQAEFRKKYPNESLHPDVLSIVGILSYTSRARDKEILRQALAEKYG